MPSPKGDLTLLCQNVQAASSMLGYAKVLPGKNALAATGAPLRVVMFPVGAKNEAADDHHAAVASSWMLVTAHFWAPGPGTDAAFDLRQRWMQALRIQADAPGYYWKFPDSDNERWNIQPDTNEQGQEFEIDVLIRIDASMAASYLGHNTVGSTSMNRVATLAVAMGTGDNAATVDATINDPTSGVLHIDNEQMSFTGRTGTTFTGIVRGINGTTAATHAVGVAVYISPT